MSEGLLWHYFADGDDLMEQTARVTLVALRETVARDVDLSAPLPRVIRSAIRRAAALRDTHAPQLRALQEIVQNLCHPETDAGEYAEAVAGILLTGIAADPPTTAGRES